MINNSLTPYLLIISLGSGAIGFSVFIIEAYFIYRFIEKNQNDDFTPNVDPRFDQTQKNKVIREFRSKIMNNKEPLDSKFLELRRTLTVFKWSITLLLTVFVITFIATYLSSK